MGIVFVFLCLALLEIMKLVPVVSGQITRDPPIIPTLPPPPKFTTVVNGSALVLIGEPVTVFEDVQVIIDCGPLINASGVSNPVITWFKNGYPIRTNGSALNVVISQDERFCIITETYLAIGAHIGIEGKYSCEVCSNLTTCNTNVTDLAICGEPHLAVPGPPIINPFIISITCGQDATVVSLDSVVRLTINCPVFNGSYPLTFKVYKDGVLISNTVPYVITNPDDDDAGTYTIIVCTKLCGAVSATSRILLQDVITVSFEQSTYSVNETDGPVRPALVLSNPSAIDITVRVFSAGETATGGGVDHGPGPYTVTFSAGVTRVEFDVPITDDDTLENNETFTLTIVPNSLPSGVTRGDPTVATVTIVDDDDDACSIEGQVFTTCGTSCPPTCGRPQPGGCVQNCVTGCQCPNSTVLDEITNECVKRDQCTCPPTCSHEYCSVRQNRRKPCSRPPPLTTPACPDQCRSTYCSACYYSERVRRTPRKCISRACRNQAGIKSWAKCVSKHNDRRNKCKDDCITAENFRCYDYPPCNNLCA